MPPIKTSRGGIPIFQTPQALGSLSQKGRRTFEDCWNAPTLGTLHKKMEQTMIELSRFKLQWDKHETKQLELETKLEYTIHELESLKHNIMVYKV